MKKFMMIVISIVLIFSLVLTGCGNSGKSSTSNSSTSNSNEKSNLSGSITVWSWNVAAKTLQEAADNFVKANPNVKIDVKDIGRQDVYDKLTVGLAAGSGLPDVVSIEDDHVSGFVKKFPNGFLDLTNEITPIKDKFISSKVANATVDGKFMAIPWDAAPAAIFYRTDIFKDAGINPDDIKTWDDYIAAGKKIVEKTNGKVKMLGIDEKADDGLYRVMLNEQNSWYFDKNGKPILNSKESINAMSKIKEMVDAGIVDNVNGWDGGVTATKNGLVATSVSGVWWLGTLQDQCKDQSGKWGVFPLPAFKEGDNNAAALGGSTLMVPSSTKNKELAVAFAKFAMTDKESVKIGFTKYGLFPSLVELYNDPVFSEGVEYCGGQKIWPIFADIAKRIPGSTYFTENFAETQTHVYDAQAAILLMHQDVSKTLDDLQKNTLSRIGK
ncbi:sugar ABC transporter substrate-binding protein [Thermoanaerobacterium sp. RBIITD]|uniref:ABC transporter substrate-binding protein n=1 Tax=Thermoanaerobacterium sp. RBIITD TaxID=1550240 RepID=UPI000BB88445|nr:sugar ABC transporter substrate-binding protein [Thermoanaerobacterium sp. RBIITD]SNX52724.1 lactose/L-arabinose transport system substrate-binding protein [Thermoanaerobacterium sp. RBIITD]